MTGRELITIVKRLSRRVLPDGLYRLYRRRRITGQITRYTSRQVTHTYGATTLTIELTDPLAEGWYDHDWPPLPELERLREHGLRPGARVFDIGAHQGIVALMLADYVGQAGGVVAVEAQSHNARIAERNRILNGASNVEVIHAAGAAFSGSVLFAEGLNGRVEQYGSRWGKLEVAAVTVDELALRHGSPDIVVVDVEGFEAQVLAGAAATISSKLATFLIEVHVGHGLDCPPEEVLGVFGPPYRLLIAPASDAGDRFADYAPGSAVLAKRFFLIATPLTHSR
jgi:FkbM family methyltransferase